MHDSNLVIELATRADIPEILDLQERNLLVNGGTLSQRFSAAPVLAARSDGRVVGYVAATTWPRRPASRSPKPCCGPIPAPGAYVYGPICVAEDHRGRGLARMMFAELRARLPGREGFTSFGATTPHQWSRTRGWECGRSPNSLMAASPMSSSLIRGEG